MDVIMVSIEEVVPYSFGVISKEVKVQVMAQISQHLAHWGIEYFMNRCKVAVDAGPMGFPTEKREEDLVQLGFPTCNPTRTSYM